MDDANITARAEECDRLSSIPMLSPSVPKAVVMGSILHPTFIFFAIRKPEEGGGVGEKGGVSLFSSVPESSSPMFENTQMLDEKIIELLC